MLRWVVKNAPLQKERKPTKKAVLLIKIVKEEVFVVVQEVFSLAVEVKNILKNKVIHLVVNLKLTFYISSRKSIPLSCG